MEGAFKTESEYGEIEKYSVDLDIIAQETKFEDLVLSETAESQ